MKIFNVLSGWLDYKRKRRTLARLLEHFSMPLVFWYPPADSPLCVGKTTLRMPLDGIIGPRTIAYGHWHGEHTRLIESKLVGAGNSSYFLIDVGANIGLVTRQLLASPRLRWSGAACFEPEAGNIESLRWNIAPLENAIAFPVAISDKDSVGTLHVDLGNAGDCSLDPLPKGIKRSGVSSQEVNLVSGSTAYDMIQRRNSPEDRIVWKSDTQGHDLNIMASMPRELWTRVSVAMIEVRCSNVSDDVLLRFLEIVADFPHRSWIKRREQPVTLDQLKKFCERRNSSEMDLLLYR